MAKKYRKATQEDLNQRMPCGKNEELSSKEQEALNSSKAELQEAFKLRRITGDDLKTRINI